MSQEASQAKVDPAIWSLSALVLLNLVPLYGVLSWGWQSFDLIFLYWMENLVIGAFTLARMLVRPYSHPLELAYPLFLAPFFAAHYGMFTWGHGTFVVSLFGPSELDSGSLLTTTLELASSATMMSALLALTLLQVMDWIRDISKRGLGADNIRELMVRPYRRIVVLHITILGAGFALGALDEPVVGLMVLVAVKTIADVWHWRRDSRREQAVKNFEFTPERLAQMQDKFPRPVVTVNGKDEEYATFAELKSSGHFRLAQAVMRFVGAGEELRAMNTYLEMKIAEEERADSGWSRAVEGGSA